jgi:hypothetical protein
MKPCRYLGASEPFQPSMIVRALAALAGLVATLSTAAPAHAAIELGVQDDPLVVRLPSAFGGFGAARLLPPAKVDAALSALRVDTVRINVPWSSVAGARAGARLELGLYDLAVDRERAAGRRVQMTLSGPAPRWATGNHRVSAYKPDARRYAAFVHAVAAHFRGRVARYSIWNEPNWWNLLRPRRDAVRIYRRLYLRGSRAVKAADPAAKVLIGELAPLGQPEAATPPLRFLRRLTCSDRSWRRARRCPRLVADGFALHPYSLRWAPDYPGPHPDDVTIGSLRRLTLALDRLARRRALGTRRGGSLQLYLTEWGYHARSARVREPQRSAYVRRGLALAARVRRVRQIVWYQLAGPPAAAHVHWDTGLLGPRGRRRPVFGAVRGWSWARAKRPRPPVALPVAATAAAPPPGRRVPGGGLASFAPLVAAADPSGGVALSWASGERRRLSRSRGVRFRRARSVGGADPEDFPDSGRVAVGPRGDVALAWTRNDHSIRYPADLRADDCCERVRAVTVTRGGRRTRPRTLSPKRRHHFVTAVAAGPGRRVGVAFTDASGRLWASVGTARRGFGPRERLQLPLGDGNRVAALWFRGGRAHAMAVTRRRVVELRRLGRRRWSRPRTLLRGVSEFLPFQVGTARDGRQVALLQRGGHVVAARRRPGRRFHTQRLLLASAPTMALATAPGGSAVVAIGDYGSRSVRFATARPGRRFGRFRVVRAGGELRSLGAAAGAGGRAAVAWVVERRRGRRGRRYEHALRGLRVGSRPRDIARRRGQLTLADGAPLYRGRTPLVAYNDDGAVTTAPVR